jgi:hypothetical protein
MNHIENDFIIIRRTDDNTYDVFYKSKSGKLDFVSNHDTYEKAVEDLNQSATKEYINSWGANLKNNFKESFEEFYNKKQI